ncbi:MAG: altronate dehydratase family protein [Clostridiales bacterium]|jgi:altronate hydrolase|nr:altronate dehydratase family protein [Clostridiales bacterium]
MNAANALKINEKDNVAVTVSDMSPGSEAFGAIALEAVPAGHKIALRDIPAGALIIKYGFPIGQASRDIKAGAHVHSHNASTNLKGLLEYSYKPAPVTLRKPESGSFMGYLRPDKKAGIRNEIWIINTVGCVSKISEKIAEEASKRLKGIVDGVYAFPHPYGCSQLGEDHENTRLALAGLAKHPNAAGILVVGLGCENNTVEDFKKLLGDYDTDRIKFLVAQDSPDEIQEGLALVDELGKYAASYRRLPLDIGMLVFGLKCGGSDAFSGITANPLAGRISDSLVSYGGAAILTEVPEMFGAEQLLMDRCDSRATFDATVELVNGFKTYFLSHGQEVGENPSPGNKAGGITTLEEKSLGCVQKGGESPVRGVLQYGQQLSGKGLNLLQGPGNDIVASTALAAAGAHMILFTTGRGTPLGSPVPVVKIATNSGLAKRKPSWIDFDAGMLLSGSSFDEAEAALWRLCLETAEGKLTRNERNGYREIAIFKNGITL